jgi:hypothetical protein
MSELLDRALKTADEADNLYRRLSPQKDNVIEGEYSEVIRIDIKINNPFLNDISDDIKHLIKDKFEGEKIISSLDLFNSFHFAPIKGEYDHNFEIYEVIKEFSDYFSLNKEDYLKLLINVLEKGCKYKENENFIAREIISLTNSATYIDMMLVANRDISAIKPSFIEKANMERQLGKSHIENILSESISYSREEIDNIMSNTFVSYFSENESLRDVKIRAETFANKNSFRVGAIYNAVFEEAMHKMAERLTSEGKVDVSKIFLKYGNVQSSNYEEAKNNRINHLKSYQDSLSMQK